MRSATDGPAATARDEPAAGELTPIAEPTAPGRNRRRHVLESTLALLFVAGVVVLGVVVISHRSTSTPQTRGPASHRIIDHGMAPGAPPPVRVKPLERTGQRIDRASVLVRVPAGTPATVRAWLGFVNGGRGRVRDTAIVVARPGTQSAAAPWGTGSYYRSARVAISARVGVTSPMHRILSVTTPADLRPGVYPVLTVVHTALLPGQHPGLHGPYQETSELGVVVVTAR